MEGYKKESKSKFLKIYLYFSIISSFLAFLLEFKTNLLLNLKEGLLYSLIGFIIGIFSLLLFAYTIISIYALVNFIRNKLNKLTLVIPIVEISTSFISILLGIINIFIDVTSLFMGIRFLEVPLNLFIIGFAIFILNKFRKK